ncbi:MAG: hypothetical protein R2708_16970 [Vicinamibacterales bacterium]
MSEPRRLRQLARTFGPDLWALRGAFVEANAFTLVAVVGNALAPWPLKWIIDGLLAPDGTAARWPAGLSGLTPDTAILALGGLFLALALGSAVAEAADGVITARIRERLGVAIRDRMLGHLLTLPPTIRTTHRSGELGAANRRRRRPVHAAVDQDRAAPPQVRGDLGDHGGRHRVAVAGAGTGLPGDACRC